MDQEENSDTKIKFEDLFELVSIITNYFMEHNAECDAIDLLMEVDRIDQIGEVFFFKLFIFKIVRNRRKC